MLGPLTCHIRSGVVAVAGPGLPAITHLIRNENLPATPSLTHLGGKGGHPKITTFRFELAGARGGGISTTF